ncbi:MAG TPA: hypothetical protein VKA05_04575 [Acidimicrobiales bacterium]|nr:hypothetical protein [Acidimicrobiales bacterium]
MLQAGGLGVIALAAAGAGVVELVDHGVLPGKTVLDVLDGACSVADPSYAGVVPGPFLSGHFDSRARDTKVGWTVAYPPGHQPGDHLPVCLVLHGWGVTHSEAFTGLRLQFPLATVVERKQARPFVLAAADGGNGYWHVHGDDDPLAMLHDEFLPLLAVRGLDCAAGRPPATFGWSMGGYGSLLYGETYPTEVAAVTADDPAIWLSWPQARAANPTAFTSAADFSGHDVVTNARRLDGVPVQVRGGVSDPFAPSTVMLQRALGPSRVIMSKGCHTSPFMLAAAPLLLAFAGSRLG